MFLTTSFKVNFVCNFWQKILKRPINLLCICACICNKHVINLIWQKQPTISCEDRSKEFYFGWLKFFILLFDDFNVEANKVALVTLVTLEIQK